MIEAKVFMGSKEIEKLETGERRSPYSGEVVSTFPICSAEDAKEALNVARDAFEVAKKSPLSQRIAWLRDVAKRLKEQKELFAKTITDEIGKPLMFSRVEVDRCVETIELTADALTHLRGETIPTDATFSGKKSTAFWRRVPAGVVVAITPFNFPLNLAAHKLAPALGAGCSVVLKPTPEAPVTGYLFAKLFIESEYAIENALSVVYGDAEVGSALVTSDIPRVISFTGSVPVGNIITKSAGIKKVSLELGGNAATFVEKSADISHAAARCAFGAFVNSGQVCISLQRIYVDSCIYDEFAEAIAKETKKLKVGSPYDDDTFMGPLINEEAKDRAMSWVESAKKEGARAIAGGELVDGIFAPTVIADVRDDMQIVCEEVFAPIVSLVKVESFDEAVKKMNDSPYGLQFSIFTNDLKMMQQALDQFECGGIVVNDVPTVRFDIQPYGGMKLSGVGREGPQFALEEFTEIQSVVIF
ncbi:aldehyde dehydrogenase family protein [Hydrogenimonas thermophila]|uniref:aldehyde dehydrogenase family protein n=1 Tax=Hydrogenimonas thermophila TaxID=223786 RepID=UPI002937356D|nr:aldehyde dehydrogenase family protein [Hydrogenimonas thermophila]WOE69685.1 aldehyde dehydrogenase family protein [Hydrogenimonas thermophila]WOE72199.1 aldehyde dehydrogenase family protein [Hydrogenimonas thermophila]